MQRPAYPVPPASSPPLHHPVPQHVSTVPQLRSPPPPASQNSQQGGYGYGQSPPQQGQSAAGGSSYMHPAFGGFINDPTAQMGFQMGKTAVTAGQEYMEKEINRWVSVSALKHYFNVSNGYVMQKLFIVLFPWRHRPWSRQQARMGSNGQAAEFLPPREDVNSPDMYIPTMAFVTYILMTSLIAGLHGNFEPQILGNTATVAFLVILMELIVLWMGRYFLNISSESQIYDLVAYSGYKFVGVITTVGITAVFNAGKGSGGYVGWGVFLYTFNANAFFLLRSLKYVLLPSDNSPGNPSMQTIARGQRSRRTTFLFIYSYLVQFAFMWWLTVVDASGAKVKGKGGK